MHRGRFITFEGMDGCGKTTQLRLLAVALRGFCLLRRGKGRLPLAPHPILATTILPSLRRRLIGLPPEW